jgi:SRSO17 transposase
VTPIPDVEPASHATEQYEWPGLATSYLVRASGQYYAWTDYPDHSKRDARKAATAEAAREYLAAIWTRLLLGLEPGAVIARAEAHCVEQDEPLFAAVAARPPGGGETWLAASDAASPGTHTLTRWADHYAAVEAFAAVTEQAARRIEQMPVTWPDIIAGQLRYRVQVARTAAARAELGAALRRHQADIRASATATRAARMADVGITYLYKILGGDAWTWEGALLDRVDLRSAERRRKETRHPGAALTGTEWPAHATFAVEAGNLNQARRIATTVLDALHVTPGSALRAEPLRPGTWTVHADIQIPGTSAIDPGDAHSRAVHLAGLIRGAGDWNLREGPGHVEAEWPPDIWSADPKADRTLVTRAVKAAVIRTTAPATVPRPRLRYPARRTGVQGRSPRALRTSPSLSLTGATSEFEAMLAGIACQFARPEVRGTARAYLLKLAALSDRLYGWELPAREPGPTREQIRRLLDPVHAVWSADQLRDDVRSYVTSRFGKRTATLAVAETAFHKQGTSSAGVQRQYSPVSGRLENCQIGVFLGYVSDGRTTLIDRELFLPEIWTMDPLRSKARAGIPKDIAYKRKPDLARAMIARVRGAGVPYRWVTADSACSDDSLLRVWLADSGTSFVLPVRPDLTVDAAGGPLSAGELIEAQDECQWRLLPDGAAATPTAMHEWTMITTASPRRHLLARRARDRSELSLFDCRASAGCTLEDLAEVARNGHAITACMQAARNEAGLAEYLALRYESWYRHVTVSLLAAAFLSVLSSDRPAPRRSRPPRGPRPNSQCRA